MVYEASEVSRNMIVYLVQAFNNSGHHYTLGVYSTEMQAQAAARREESFRGGKYDCMVQEFEVVEDRDLEDGVSLQEQVEALQLYMSTVQTYVLILKDAMMILLDMPDIRRVIGEKTTNVLRKDLAECRRSTWDKAY